MKIEDLKKKVELIKVHCEAGTILEYMDLFDDVEKELDSVKWLGYYMGEDMFTFDEEKYKREYLGEFSPG